MTVDQTQLRRMLEENELLLREAALEFDRADVAEAIIIRSEKINRLLKRRREIYLLLTGEVPAYEHVFSLSNTPIPTMCVLIGRAAIPYTRVGEQNPGVKMHHCLRCGGLLNYEEVYPDLEIAPCEINLIGCVCP
jgi:hypothetical protein